MGGLLKSTSSVKSKQNDKPSRPIGKNEECDKTSENTITKENDILTGEDSHHKIHEQRLKNRVCDYLRDFETKKFIYDAHISFRKIRLQIISRIYERHKFRLKRESEIMQQIRESEARTLSVVTKAATYSIRELGKAKIFLDHVEELKKARGMVTFARRLADYRIAQIYDEMSRIILERIAQVFGLDPEFRFKLERPMARHPTEVEPLLIHLLENNRFDCARSLLKDRRKAISTLS